MYVCGERAAAQPDHEEGDRLAEVEPECAYHQAVVGGGEHGQVHTAPTLLLLLVLDGLQNGLRLGQVGPVQEN